MVCCSHAHTLSSPAKTPALHGMVTMCRVAHCVVAESLCCIAVKPLRQTATRQVGLLLWFDHYKPLICLLHAPPPPCRQAELRPPTAAAAAGGADGGTAAQHAAAVAAATAVLNEASASVMRDVIAKEGISEEQRAANLAEAREQRMQQLLYAITVLASNSGACGCLCVLLGENKGGLLLLCSSPAVHTPGMIML